MSWIRRNLRLPNNGARPVFLIEPMVMLGDLDKDIDGRIRHSNRSGEGGSLRDYAKMRVMDLSEIHAGGAGNAPILGQYLAKIILNKSPTTSPTRSGRPFIPIWWTPAASRPTSPASISTSSVPGAAPAPAWPPSSGWPSSTPT